MSEGNAPEVPAVAPADIEFRPMQAADIGIGLQLCRLAGWDQAQRDWERFVAAKNASAHVAVFGATSSVVGTVATIRYGVEFGWIGMVLVHPDMQGRGVGAVLLKHATAELAGLPAIRLDATPAGHLLYRKHGFIDECSVRRMEAAPTTVQGANHGLVKPLTREGLPDVFALDRQVFGAPRHELLEWMREGAPEYSFVAHEGQQVSGYLFGRHGYEFEHLGPIVAADARVAVELTRTCLAAHPGRRFVIDSASDADDWRLFLDQTGFREQRPYIRMNRGAPGQFGQPSQQFAILGPEFG